MSDGSCDDHVRGGMGDDDMWGGNGTDTIYGHNGKDDVDGGKGNDWIHGGEGFDTIYRIDGSDTIVGGNDADTNYGGLARTLLRALAEPTSSMWAMAQTLSTVEAVRMRLMPAPAKIPFQRRCHPPGAAPDFRSW